MIPLMCTVKADLIHKGKVNIVQRFKKFVYEVIDNIIAILEWLRF